MWLTALSIRRPLVVLMAVLALMVVGIISYTKLPVDLLPNASFPYVFVTIEYPGAGPRDVESQVTRPAEDALASINGLKRLASTSTDNVSIVVMQFRDGTNPNDAQRDAQLKLNAILSTLPPQVKTPSIAKFDPASAPSWDFALEGDRPLEQLYQIAKDTIVPRLEAVNGVASVTITGGLEREVRVDVDPRKLSARGLSMTDVRQVLASTNVSIPGGTIHGDTQDVELRLYGLEQQVEGLGGLPLRTLPDGGTIHLSDIATIQSSFKDPTYITRVNGHPGVGLLIRKQQGANTVAVSAELRAEVSRLAPQLPEGVHVSSVYDQGDFVKQSLDSVNTNVREAIIITGIVLLLFLHTWRSTLIVLLSIPTSLIATFIVMKVAGYSLNMMSTMGLALTIGILVDDSIVILENISRHMHMGESPSDAAVMGRAEIGGAAVAITLVDVVVYAPMAFMTGIVGQFFKEFGVTIVVATLFSLAVSFTLTPMLAAFWIRPEQERRSRLRPLWDRWERGYDAVARAYRRSLVTTLRFRWLTVAGAGLVFVAGVGLAGSGLIGSEFLHEADQGAFTASIDLPPGTSLEETNRQVAILDQRLARQPEVQALLTSVGIGGQFDRAQHWSAKIAVRLTPKEQRHRSVWEMAHVVHDLAADIPGMKIRTNLPSVAGTTSQPIILDVKGRDLAALSSQAKRVEAAMRAVPGTADVNSTGGDGAPEVRLVIDQQKAAQVGVIPAQLGDLLRVAYHGDVATRFRREGQDPLDVEVRLADADRRSARDLADMLVTTSRGTMVRLGQIATIVSVAGPAQINRADRQYNVQIGANLGDRPLGAVSADIQHAVEALKLPPEISVSYQGDTEQQSEGFADLAIALGLSVLAMYMLMVALYNSLTHPLVIMCSLPVASVGAFLALYVTGATLNIMSMVGIIMLTGLVAKNAILLVDYTNTLRKRGMERRDAILEAGPVRLRPIIMTTAAMVFAMLPLALSLGEGSETRSPMAIVVIGGLLTSTVLTLFVVPAGYTLMDDLQEWVLSVIRRGTAATSGAVPNAGSPAQAGLRPLLPERSLLHLSSLPEHGSNGTARGGVSAGTTVADDHDDLEKGVGTVHQARSSRSDAVRMERAR